MYMLEILNEVKLLTKCYKESLKEMAKQEFYNQLKHIKSEAKLGKFFTVITTNQFVIDLFILEGFKCVPKGESVLANKQWTVFWD